MGKSAISYNSIVKTPLLSTRSCVDLSENIHIHYRDLRIELSIKEWRELEKLVNLTSTELSKCEYEEGTNKFKDFIVPINKEPKYFSNRLQVELLNDNIYHLHYNNIRLELNRFNLEEIIKLSNKILNTRIIKTHHIKVSVLNEIGEWEIKPITESPNYLALEDMYIHEEYVKLINKLKPEAPITSTYDYERLIKSINELGVNFENDPPITIREFHPPPEDVIISDGHHRICYMTKKYNYEQYILENNKIIGVVK